MCSINANLSLAYRASVRQFIEIIISFVLFNIAHMAELMRAIVKRCDTP